MNQLKTTAQKALSALLTVCMLLSMLPALTMNADAAVSAGINDMTALDALGIDISKAPEGYDPNTTENPFGRETTSIAVVDELFTVGRSGDEMNYSKLYGDNWAVGGSVKNFFSDTPTAVGTAASGSNWIFNLPWSNNDAKETANGADAISMIEANLDMTGENGGSKDSVAFISYKAGYLNLGIVAPKSYNAGYTQGGGHNTVMHNTVSIWLDAYAKFGNKENKITEDKAFENEYVASTYLKISAGDYDGDGVDEIAVYVPNRDSPCIVIYKLQSDWSGTPTALQPIMTFQLDTYKATKAVSGDVQTAVGDTLIPNMVSLVSADFDMDGIDDLALSYGYTGKAMDSAPCKARMLFGAKAGQFGVRSQEIPLNDNGTAIVRASFATGDLDGDGENELVVGGSVAGTKFNANERYVAIYRWNGAAFALYQSKKINPFEKDSNGNYVNTNVPASKTTYYSAPITPANIAVGHFNGISNPVSIYIDSMLISLEDDGMVLAAMLDEQLRNGSCSYAEWGARAAQLTGNGTDTLVTMTDNFRITFTQGSFWEYINACMSARVPKKTCMSAVYGDAGTLESWNNRVDGAAFCLPNTDRDSSTVRYTGEHYFTYIDPEILAVLASPPYFADLDNDELGGSSMESGTSYGTSSGSGGGSSYSNTLSVGLYSSYEKSVTFFGVELFRVEAELEINNHMTWETLNTSTVEQSVTYETLAGQDTVVFFTMPIETYVYEQSCPVTDKNGNFIKMETQSMTVNIPHEASVRNLPLDTYERIAADYDELPQISGAVIRHTLGVPSSYPSDAESYGSTEFTGLPTLVSSGDPANVGYGSSSQTKEITMTSETEKSFNYELDISTKVGVGGGGVMVGITAGYAHGAGTVSISTSGSTYSGSIYALPAVAEAYGYNFNWRLFCYPYTNDSQTFPVVNYIVTDLTQPPMLPDNFSQLDEGTTQDTVALTWQHSGNPAGFTIYRYFRAAGSADFYEVATVPAGNMDYITAIDGNTRTYRYLDAGLSADTEYLYRIQTVGSAQPGFSVLGKTLTAYTKPEGIVPEVGISANELTVYPDTEHTATVSVTNADKLAGSALFFQWQKFDEQEKIWQDVATLNTMTIRFTNAGLDDAGRYRCKVTSRQNTTIVSSYSPELAVTYSKRTAILSDFKATPDEAEDKGTLSVKLSGSGTKTIPSGTVVFTLEAQGYYKQYAASVNSQGVAAAEVSAVPGVYKVTADYNGNRVFAPGSTDTDAHGNSVFYVFGEDAQSTFYWDYADSYTYGGTMTFTKYTMDGTGAVTGTEILDFSAAINGGEDLWLKMELYTLPATKATFDTIGEYKMPAASSNEYRALAGSGAKDVLGDYKDTALTRFAEGKAGWVGSYYIPYDLNGDDSIANYTDVKRKQSFDTSSVEPEGFYFTVEKAPLTVKFKDMYQNVVMPVSDVNLYTEYKAELTEDNYADYGFSAEDWTSFIDHDSDVNALNYVRKTFTIDSQTVLCEYSVGRSNIDGLIWLTYTPLEPNGPTAELVKNENVLQTSGALFGDDPLESVSADTITDTGLQDAGYIITSKDNSEQYTFTDERLFTWPTNLWAFRGHYYTYNPGYQIQGMTTWADGGNYRAPGYTADGYTPEHGLNVFRHDCFGDYDPISKVTGQYTLGIEPVYYVNYYERNTAYLRPHAAQNYEIICGTALMTVTGPAYAVSAEPDNETQGSVSLTTPATGTAQKYPVGTQLVFVAAPNKGFDVDYWMVNGVKKQDGGAQLTVTQTADGTAVTVYFKVKANTLIYSADPEDPSVDGAPVVNTVVCPIPSGKEPMAGAEISLAASAADGWHFAKWEVHTDGAATRYVTGETLNITMPDASVRVYGIFERDSYRLTLGEHLVALSESKALDTSKPIAGDTEITVRPAAGYELQSEWSVTDGVADTDSEDGTFTFTLLTDTDISAALQAGTYEVTIPDTIIGGTLTVSGAEDVSAVPGGTALTFTARPARGYQVQRWLVDGAPVASRAETYACAAAGDLEVSVEFEEKAKRTVTVSVASESYAELAYAIDGADYTETYSGGNVELYEGETLIIAATPRQNDMVSGWRIDGSYAQRYDKTYTVPYNGSSTVGEVEVVTQSMFDNTISFETAPEDAGSPAADAMLAAAADGESFNSGASVGAGKALEFSFSGSDISVSRWTITYEDGGETDILNEYGALVISNELTIPYTLNNATIKAYYKADDDFETAQITTDSGITTAPENTVRVGETVTVTVPAPGADERINSVTAAYGTVEHGTAAEVGGVQFTGFDSVTANHDGSYTCVIAGIPGDVSITADVAALYSITIGAVTNGSVAAAPAKAAAGDTVNLTVTPEEGYTLESLTITDGTGPVSAADDNSFLMPAGPVTVSASFVSQSTDPVGTPPSVTTASLPDGTVNAAYSQALAATGDTPVEWSIDSGSLPNGLTLSTDGVICGTPTTAGTFSFTVRAANGVSPNATKALSIEIAAESGTGGDSPSGGGDSPSGGGGSSVPSASVPTVSGSTATTTVPSTITNGSASASVTSSQMTDALEAARQAAAGTGEKAKVEIKLDGTDGAFSAAATIPQSSVQALVSGGAGGLTVSSGVASVTFDADALSTISGGASGDVTISTSQVDTMSLPAAAQALVGNRPVYEFSVTSGGNTISQFNGSAEVSAPYTLGAGEDPNAVIVSYINPNGNLETVMNGRYDASSGTVTFTTTHFSQYTVGYNKVSFTDVPDSSWYADAVTYLAARGITGGTAETTFSPNATLTRGEFITLLLRAYGVKPIKNAADNFSDGGDTYYTDYLAAAKRLGISNGVGGNRFAPEQAVTRQEMFTLLYNALKVLDRLPNGNSGKTTSNYTDSERIASYAQEAMAYLVKTGIVSGDERALLPEATTTRAQMAQVLYNLLSN